MDFHEFFNKWLDSHGIFDKDDKTSFRKNNRTIKGHYSPINKIIVNPEDFGPDNPDFRKLRLKKIPKFEKDISFSMDEWLDRNDIVDKDKKLMDWELKAYPPDIMGKKARIRIQSSLDLHQMTVDQAILCLNRYIKNCYDNEIKVVRIIHGKGIHSKGPPRLKSAVRSWLNHEGRSYIRYYQSADPALGGSGALIVWLH